MVALRNLTRITTPNQGIARSCKGRQSFPHQGREIMASRSRRDAAQTCDSLLKRLQQLLYEYEAMGELERARPHILWLMEIAEQTRTV